MNRWGHQNSKSVNLSPLEEQMKKVIKKLSTQII